MSDNFSDYVNDKYTNTTITDNAYVDINRYPSTIASMSSKHTENCSTSEIDRLINDPVTNRKDLTMMLRKRMFNNSNVLKFNDLATFENEIVNINLEDQEKSVETDVNTGSYKFDLLETDKSVNDNIAKHPLVIRDTTTPNNNNNNNIDIVLALNKKELNVLQINKRDGSICWESLLLEIYNIPFEFSDDKLESLFRSCKFKIISLQREQHLFNRPSNATICISYKTSDLKVLEVGSTLASHGILLHVKQIITY